MRAARTLVRMFVCLVLPKATITCLTGAAADPTQPGVWWREDDRWVRYPAHLEQAVLDANAAGQHNVVLPLGQVASAKHPHGATYNIDLVTMEQINESSGYSRDVKIVPHQSNDRYRSEIEGLIDGHKQEVERLVKEQGLGRSVRWSPHLNTGSPVYDRFIKAASVLPASPQPDTTTRLAFHGTGEENNKSILEHGMDPNKRVGYQHWSGIQHYDWYGTHLDEANVVARGAGKNVIVFALLVDPRLGDSGFTTDRPKVIRGSKSDYALPLGEISLTWK